MAQFLFYEQPVALNRERHQRLKLAVTARHYAFAAKTNAVPIASTEFFDAARDYPIVFVGEEGGPFNVAALVGLRSDENLMVDAQGRWAENTYIPAFARRYPFVLARGADDKTLTVCIDEVYGGLSEQAGEALFDAQGSETPYLQRVLEFLGRFHQETERTTLFASRLKELGLLTQKVINVDRHGQRQSLQGIWMVDEERLGGLDDGRVVELFRLGQLAWIDAHLMSLRSLPRLAARLDDESRLSEPVSEPALGNADAVPSLKH